MAKKAELPTVLFTEKRPITKKGLRRLPRGVWLLIRFQFEGESGYYPALLLEKIRKGEENDTMRLYFPSFECRMFADRQDIARVLGHLEVPEVTPAMLVANPSFGK